MLLNTTQQREKQILPLIGERLMETTAKPSITVNLTQRARDYLAKAGTTELHINAVEIQECCIPLVAPPTVHKGAPLKPERYHRLQVDGYTVYYDRDLIQRPDITIDASGLSFARGLKITDWEIRY